MLARSFAYSLERVPCACLFRHLWLGHKFTAVRIFRAGLLLSSVNMVRRTKAQQVIYHKQKASKASYQGKKAVVVNVCMARPELWDAVIQHLRDLGVDEKEFGVAFNRGSFST